MNNAVPVRRSGRADALIVGASALVSLLLSPITVIWAVVVGLPVALVAWALSRTVWPRARVLWLVAVGALLGTIPYFVLAGVQAVLN